MVSKCLQCGATFPVRTTTRTSKYCSRECYGLSQRSVLTTACLHCGTVFSYPAARPGKYCCRACYEAARAEHNTVTKHCEVCGKAFTVSASTAHRYNRCSSECGKAERRVKCKRCGKEFLARPGTKRSYCSEECRRPPAMVTCIECGKRHRAKPCAAKARRFCSIACYRRHRGETTLEGTVRASLERLGVAFEQERKVGRYSVDFFLPRERIALEVDGAYWHPSPARDAQRDRRLAEGHGVRVARLREREVLDAADLDSLVTSKLHAVANA
jgi:very-short-patch-repair endonuclease